MVYRRFSFRQTAFVVCLAPLIAQIGFPAPAILALWVTFNESIGALLIGCGLFTRVLAISAALGMTGALYTGVRLGEDWLRAALYLIVFLALSLTGAGKYSIDRTLQIRRRIDQLQGLVLPRPNFSRLLSNSSASRPAKRFRSRAGERSVDQ